MEEKCEAAGEPIPNCIEREVPTLLVEALREEPCGVNDRRRDTFGCRNGRLNLEGVPKGEPFTGDPILGGVAKGMEDVVGEASDMTLPRWTIQVNTNSERISWRAHQRFVIFKLNTGPRLVDNKRLSDLFPFMLLYIFA